MATAAASPPQISTICTLNFGQQYIPPDRAADNRSAPGFFFTPTTLPWSDNCDYAGLSGTKYMPMWDLRFHGGGSSEASRNRPRTGGTARCPTSDPFWTSPSMSHIREPFLDMAFEHIALPESSSSESESEDQAASSSGALPGQAANEFHVGGTDQAVRAQPWSFNQFTSMTQKMGGGTWPAPGSGLCHQANYTGQGANDLKQLSLSLDGLVYNVSLVTGTSLRSTVYMNRSWAEIYSRKTCRDCATDLRMAVDHVSSHDHITASNAAMRACFQKCCNKDQRNRACQDINKCKPCKDAVANGFANYVMSSVIAFKACVDDCETWEDLQDRQKTAIREYTETCTEGSENHPKHISEAGWWQTVPSNGKFPQVLWALLLELDARLLGDTGITPGLRYAHLPEDTGDNGGHSMSYMWQENAGAASAFTLLVLAWRQAFGNSLRVHDSAPLK